MKKTVLTGQEVLERWNLHDIEIFVNVKAGLQPYNSSMQPIPSPPQRDIDKLTFKIKECKKEIDRYTILNSGFNGKKIAWTLAKLQSTDFIRN